jgi:hypothetical protein
MQRTNWAQRNTQQPQNQNLVTTKGTKGHRGKSKATPTPKPKPQRRGPRRKNRGRREMQGPKGTRRGNQKQHQNPNLKPHPSPLNPQLRGTGGSLCPIRRFARRNAHSRFLSHLARSEWRETNSRTEDAEKYNEREKRDSSCVENNLTQFPSGSLLLRRAGGIDEHYNCFCFGGSSFCFRLRLKGRLPPFFPSLGNWLLRPARAERG